MYSYLIGTVVEMNIDHIVVENSGIGYLIYVNNPYEYTRGKEIKIFLYQQVKEDALLLYGFKTSEEKEMFLKLILVFPYHYLSNLHMVFCDSNVYSTQDNSFHMEQTYLCQYFLSAFS